MLPVHVFVTTTCYKCHTCYCAPSIRTGIFIWVLFYQFRVVLVNNQRLSNSVLSGHVKIAALYTILEMVKGMN